MNKIFNFNGRMDGRKSMEIGIPEVKLDLIKNASGSCMIEIGETKVLAWILGPKESRGKNLDKGTVKCEFNISPFANTNRKPDFKRNLQMREFTSIIKEIFGEVILLKQYIKCEIEIQVNVLQNDGSYKAASITAVTFALISAGILIQDTAVGVSVGIMKGEYYFSDLIREEESEEAHFQCLFSSRKRKICIS